MRSRILRSYSSELSVRTEISKRMLPVIFHAKQSFGRRWWDESTWRNESRESEKLSNSMATEQKPSEATAGASSQSCWFAFMFKSHRCKSLPSLSARCESLQNYVCINIHKRVKFVIQNCVTEFFLSRSRCLWIIYL